VDTGDPLYKISKVDTGVHPYQLRKPLLPPLRSGSRLPPPSASLRGLPTEDQLNLSPWLFTKLELISNHQNACAQKRKEAT